MSARNPVRKWLLPAMCLLFVVLPAVLVVRIERLPPSTQIVLISPPVPSPTPMIHYRLNPDSNEYISVTQSCHIAEVQLKNLGPGSIVLPPRGGMPIEIQEFGSTNWIDVSQGTLGVMYKPTRPGGTLNFRISVPDTAEHWRVSTSYERWSLPQQLLNYVLREWLHLSFRVGDRKRYSIESEVWQLRSSP